MVKTGECSETLFGSRGRPGHPRVWDQGYGQSFFGTQVSTSVPRSYLRVLRQKGLVVDNTPLEETGRLQTTGISQAQKPAERVTVTFLVCVGRVRRATVGSLSHVVPLPSKVRVSGVPNIPKLAAESQTSKFDYSLSGRGADGPNLLVESRLKNERIKET